MIRYAVPVAILLLLLLSCSAQSATRFNINAEQMDYFLEEQQATAKGNVVAEWGDNRLTCDEVFVDFAEGYLQATGNVYLVQGDAGFRSDEIKYYFEKEKVIVFDARGTFVTEEVEGYVYLHSKKIEGERDELFFDEARVSTCDHDVPHYYLRSPHVEVYPGDRLIARHVSFWELSGRLPLLYWPYLYISLKDREQRITPDIGYSTLRGYFIKLTYNYFWDNSYGNVLFDIYSRTGLAGGIQHFYLDRGDDLGRLYFYIQQDRADAGLPLWEAQWEHRQETPFDGRVGAEIGVQYFSEDKVDFDTSLGWRGEGGPLTLDAGLDLEATYLFGEEENRWDDLEPVIEGNLNFRPDWPIGMRLGLEGEVEGTYLYLDEQYRWRKLEPEIKSRLEFRPDWPGGLRLNLGVDLEGVFEYLDDDYEWTELESSSTGRIDYRLSPRHRFIIDGEYDRGVVDEEVEDRWAGSALYRGGDSGLGYELLLKRDVPRLGRTGSYFYTIPELKVSSRPVYWEDAPAFLTPVTIEGLVGYYDDRDVDLAALRGGARLDYNRYFRPLNWLNLRLNQRASAYGYSTGDLFAQIFSENRLILQPLDWVRSTWTYTHREPFGESPFGFDFRERESELESDLRFSYGPWEARFSSGRDFVDQTFDDVSGQIRYRTPQVNLRLASGYKIEDREWKDVVFTAGFNFEHLDLDLGYRFNPSPFTHIKLESKVAWQATEDIKLEGVLSYDIEDQDLDTAAIRLAWDLHCRQLVFHYDHVREEFLVQYQILAFPGQKVQVLSTPDDPMIFDLELGDLFDDLF